MLLTGRATYRCNKFKFWTFWEHPLYEISEYAFKVTIIQIWKKNTCSSKHLCRQQEWKCFLDGWWRLILHFLPFLQFNLSWAWCMYDKLGSNWTSTFQWVKCYISASLTTWPQSSDELWPWLWLLTSLTFEGSLDAFMTKVWFQFYQLSKWIKCYV